MEQMKRETIVYGGAFNPPTRAHALITKACIEYAREHDADVWILPSGNRLDKVIPTSRERRLSFIAAMLMDLDTHGVNTDIPTLELDREVPVETFDTVQELAELHPDRTMTWVFGADSTETMGEWKQGDWLLEQLPKLVIERAGCTINPLARQATLLTVHTPNVSSTEVRRRLIDHEPIEELVSPEVARLLVTAIS
jgi:nicotinate-nucleotide adenylyltransferase